MSRILSLLLLLALGTSALAHKPSDSYLRLSVDGAGIEGRWDIALRDLHEVLDLDADGDGRITWGEVRGAAPRIGALARSGLQLHGDGTRCSLDQRGLAVVEHSDGPYAVLYLSAECATTPRELRIAYSLLFDIDPTHRGLLNLQFGGTHSAIFSPSRDILAVEREHARAATLFLRYLSEGAWHIWSGLDHLLFLLCLLLPAVLRREHGEWVAAPSARRAFWDVTNVVTAFTVAHALTLTAASLDWLRLPVRWVEATVAATIVFAAINNLLPLVRDRLWLVAFGFGLIHGAGYASVLAGLGLPAGTLAMALLGFNLGVEGGQILIAAAFMPLAFLARRQAWYRHAVVVPGSVLAAIIGGLWLFARLFDVRLEGLL